MPKSKKTAPSKSKLNKSAWIRAQPASMSAKDVVKKANATGIKLSVAQVYTVRTNAKKAGLGRSNGKARRASNTEVAGDLSSIKRAVFEHGFTQVEAFLAHLKKSVGL